MYETRCVVNAYGFKLKTFLLENMLKGCVRTGNTEKDRVSALTIPKVLAG